LRKLRIHVQLHKANRNTCADQHGNRSAHCYTSPNVNGREKSAAPTDTHAPVLRVTGRPVTVSSVGHAYTIAPALVSEPPIVSP